MSRIKLYDGLYRNGNWFNHTEINPLVGGALAMLDGVDKSGAARLINLLKGSITKMFTEDNKEYELEERDYLHIKVVDTWKIGYEQIKLRLGEDYPIFPENFYCDRCSLPGIERYTEIKESWARLVEDGWIDEYYAPEPNFSYKVVLPDPIIVSPMGPIMGGKFNTLIRRHITTGDMLSIHKNLEAMSTEANMIYATWDASIIAIEGMPERDFNVVVKRPKTLFTKQYLITDGNIDTMQQAEQQNRLGWDASERPVKCENCGKEIGGYLDFTNFFYPLLPKKSNRDNMMKRI